MAKRPNILFLMGDEHRPDQPEVLFDLKRNPRETVNYLAAPAYAESVAAFRRRLAALGHGPEADAEYVNAGYAPA